jgi:hypothetical protein
MRINVGVKILFKQSNYFLKAERITIGGIVEIKVNIRLKVCNDTEDHNKGIRRQNRYER